MSLKLIEKATSAPLASATPEQIKAAANLDVAANQLNDERFGRLGVENLQNLREILRSPLGMARAFAGDVDYFIRRLTQEGFREHGSKMLAAWKDFRGSLNSAQ